MEEKKMLKATQVAVELGVCPQTIDRWYKWAELNPTNDIAKMLPDYVRGGRGRGCGRLWESTCIDKFKEFQKALPVGKAGIMGDVTQKYVRKHSNDNK